MPITDKFLQKQGFERWPAHIWDAYFQSFGLVLIVVDFTEEEAILVYRFETEGQLNCFKAGPTIIYTKNYIDSINTEWIKKKKQFLTVIQAFKQSHDLLQTRHPPILSI